MRVLVICGLGFLAAACGPHPSSINTQAAPNASRQEIRVKTDPAVGDPTAWRIQSIDWDDADSGDINGVRFRLYNVDAPETGGVGAAVGAAHCALERERGLRAKAWMIEQTPAAALRITAKYGHDKMTEPRLLVEIAANGRDVGQAGIAAGYLKPWPHRGSARLAPKPDWCRPEAG